VKQLVDYQMFQEMTDKDRRAVVKKVKTEIKDNKDYKDLLAGQKEKFQDKLITKYCKEMGKKVLGVDNETLRLLLNHNWRGGVRELENVIERAVIFARGEFISVNEMSDQIKGSAILQGFPDSLKDAMRKFEKEHIIKTIKKFDYSKEEAAKALAIGLSSLYRKMEELGIPTKTNKPE